MFKKAKPFFLHVITPLHAGSGSELGVVDLPIQRERHTSFPKIESSSLKGGIREAFDESKKQVEVGTKVVNDSIRAKTIDYVFGPEDPGNNAFSGALGFTDARILLFPVKSMKGVFAWITCPRVIEKFIEELQICNKVAGTKKFGKFENMSLKKDTISDETHLKIKGSIVLEEFAFEVNFCNNTNSFAEELSLLLGIDDIKKKLVILDDNDFTDFANLSTEVITRTRISPKTGTVEPGALFTEEFLPAETVMYSLALATKIFQDEKDKKGIIFDQKDENGMKIPEEKLVMQFFERGLDDVIQLGGNATLGKGIIKTVKWSEASKQEVMK